MDGADNSKWIVIEAAAAAAAAKVQVKCALKTMEVDNFADTGTVKGQQLTVAGGK